MSNNVLVFIEQRAGKILPASFQLLTPAANLAQALGGQVGACIVGHQVGALVGAVASYGAKTVYTVDDSELAHYRAGPYAAALAAAIDQADAPSRMSPVRW